MKAFKIILFAFLCCLPLLLAACAAKAKAGSSELALGTEIGSGSEATTYDEFSFSDEATSYDGLIPDDSATAFVDEYDSNAEALPGDDVATRAALTTRTPIVSSGVKYTRYPRSTSIGYPESGGTTYQSPLTGNKYTVRKGDSLWSISRRRGVSVKTLASANNISSESKIRVGQTLSVPKGSSSGGTTYESPITGSTYTVTPGSGGSYTVQSGDSYYKIARKHGISYQALMEYNGATSSSLRVGQVLKIP